ncbi:MAG TPA: BNR-4 repeat-containing protein [Mycobacteriales bacterium]
MAGTTSAALPLRERELTGSGGWSWFGDPRAVYHQGTYRRTYTGWVAQDGSIQVASYDHGSGRRVVVTLKARLQIDDHNNPSILVRPDGRLMVFWSTHAGSTMWYRRSLRPEDVTAWEPERVLGTNTAGDWGYTYPNPVQLSAESNRIYLFWRGGNANPAMSTSLDGTTWSPARTVLYNAGQRPYVKYATNRRDTIAMAFTQAHPRAGGTNIYYAAYRAGALRRANGTVIAPMSGPPISPAQADKVYDHTTAGKAWVHDVALDSAGRPVIVYATFPTDTDHRYRYARWDGTRWIDRELTRAGRSISGDPAEPNYSGGITLDHDNPGVVYLSRQVNGVFEVEVWATADGGTTWTSRPVTSHSVRHNYRPFSPRGQLGDDLELVWTHGTYPSYTNYLTGVRTQIRTRDIADPAAVAWGPGRLDVFARDGQTSTLLQKYYSGGWSGWADFGAGPAGHPIGRPTVASWGAGRLDVFAVDQVTGQLLQRTLNNGWSGWINRGSAPSGHRLTAPAAVSWGSGRIDVVARDEVNDDLIHFWQSGTTWYGPERLAAGAGGDYVPTIASWGERRLDVFAVTSAGRLSQFFFDGAHWHGWGDKGTGPGGAALIQPAAATAWGPGRLDVFALVTGGRQIAHWWYDAGAWRGLQTLGTGPDRIQLTGLTATSWGTGRLDVFATDQLRRDLVQLFYNGTSWLGPVPQDFNSSTVGTTTTLMLDPNPRATPIPVNEKAKTAD